MVDPDHLAEPSPAGAAAPALGVAVELAPPLGLGATVVECYRRGLAGGAHQAGDNVPGGGRDGREAVLAQVPLPAVERRLGAADRLQGGRPRGALKAKLVEQRELVEAACGESSSRTASRRQNLRCGHSVCMAHFPAFRLRDCYQVPCYLKNFRVSACI